MLVILSGWLIRLTACAVVGTWLWLDAVHKQKMETKMDELNQLLADLAQAVQDEANADVAYVDLVSGFITAVEGLLARNPAIDPTVALALRQQIDLVKQGTQHMKDAAAAVVEETVKVSGKNGKK